MIQELLLLTFGLLGREESFLFCILYSLTFKFQVSISNIKRGHPPALPPRCPKGAPAARVPPRPGSGRAEADKGCVNYRPTYGIELNFGKSAFLKIYFNA